MTVAETELKPCPFCGKNPFVKRHSIGTRGHKFAITHSIECYCGMAKTKLYDTIFEVNFSNELIIETDGMKEAIEAWNGRANE